MPGSSLHNSLGSGNALTAVCITGALRWPEISLPTLRQLLLLRIKEPQKLFFIGPADAAYQTAKPLLHSHFGLLDSQTCAYPPNVSWHWKPPDLSTVSPKFDSTINGNDSLTAFALHGQTACQGKEQLSFNVAWLPFFRRCRDARYGLVGLPLGLSLNGSNGWRSLHRYDRARAQPCAGAMSLVMQLWQCAHCISLIEASEKSSGNSVFHDRVLRVRADIFFFRPVDLPALGISPSRKFSLMESSCDIKVGLHEMGRKLRPKFFQDFWFYGTRPAMRVILQSPLRRLLLYGVEQGKRSMQVMQSVSLQRQGRDRFTSSSVGLGWGKLAFGNDTIANSTLNLTTPKAFAVHPVLYGLHFEMNASSCVPFPETVGLMRVNPFRSCYGVQTRIKGASLSGWLQLGIANLSTTKWHRRKSIIKQFEALVPREARERLQRFAQVLAGCLGLRSEQGCPRVVGDKMLRNGPSEACFRSRPDIRSARQNQAQHGLAPVGSRLAGRDSCGPADTLALGTGDSRNAYKCVDLGLAEIYRAAKPKN